MKILQNKITGITIRLKKLFFQLRDYGAKNWKWIVPVITPAFALFVWLSFFPSGKSAMKENEDNFIILKKRELGKLNTLQRERVEKAGALQIEKLLLESELIQVKSDSFNIELNLQDSTLSLVIKGVTVRSCLVRTIQTSRNLNLHLSEFILTGEHYSLQKSISSIPEEPIVVKKAPKDTLEASKIMAVPEMLKEEDVYFTLFFNNDLLLKVKQEEFPEFTGFFKQLWYRLIRYFTYLGSNLRDLANLKAPVKKDIISITISRDDARALYRAIPVNSSLIVIP